MTMMRPLVVLTAVLCCALAGCSSASPSNDAGAVVVASDDGDGWNGSALSTPYVEPSLTFTDTDGHDFNTAKDTTAKATLYFFGYTACPDVCNTVLADIASALRRADKSAAENTEVVFVTIDPERDTPSAIREYLDRFDKSFIGLTADQATIEMAAEAMGVAITGKTGQVGDSYEVGHSAHVIGFQSDGTAPVLWMPGTPVGDMREDIERLVNAG